MFRLSRNERSHWSGNGVHVEPESVFMIGRNMQLSEKGQHEVFSDDPVAIKKVLLHAAYLAKRETKRRGEGYQCFGGTNK